MIFQTLLYTYMHIMSFKYYIYGKYINIIIQYFILIYFLLRLLKYILVLNTIVYINIYYSIKYYIFINSTFFYIF